MIKKKRATPEEDLHKLVVKYLNLQLPFGAVFHHSPNEGKHKPQYRKKQIAMGMQAGWPDLEIFYDDRVLFIELKAGKNTLSDTQKELHPKLKSNGFNVVTCWTLDEVKAALKAAHII